ncbi:MAG: putative dienelactone hydrolase [Proteobacteria bacterium]|nr:putative dienelactone hydrolase [Pseudomonadota bacterium]
MAISLKILALLAAFSSLAHAESSPAVGVRHMTAFAAVRGGDLDVTVWYPAQMGGTQVTLGDSPFFAGTSAQSEAPLTEGWFPLVLLSHGAGLGGTPEAMSWMAAGLAAKGFIVAAPTHPGNGGAKRSAEQTMQLWLRPGDISATLDAMTGARGFKEHVEADKVGVLGLSMGGGTALALAGGRISAERLAGYCDAPARNPSLCEWVKMSGLDLHRMDMRAAGGDFTDRRVRFAMAIDPAPVDVFDSDSFAGVTLPVEIVNLGTSGTIPETARADGVARAIPHGRYETIADASHFSLFGVCKPGAAAIAEEEKIDEPICKDGGDRSRQEIHAQLIEMAAEAFERELGGER